MSPLAYRVIFTTRKTNLLTYHIIFTTRDVNPLVCRVIFTILLHYIYCTKSFWEIILRVDYIVNENYRVLKQVEDTSLTQFL